MGKRVLDEVEETTLDEILNSLRAALPDAAAAAPSRGLKPTHMDELDRVAARHLRDTQAPTLAIAGRSLPLLYKLVATLVSPPHRQAVLVVDADGRFDATRLACHDDDDLRHVYVQQCGGAASPEHLRALVADAEAFMLYHAAARPSRSRRWWGTVVVLGGAGAPGLGGGDVVAGWKGWLRVDRDQVQPFALGVGVDDALAERDARQRAVDAAGWAATSPWGGFVFYDG
ncbi:peptidase M43, pregnancy-associated plasma-A [Hirsutella rhossiliensis]|uniref:Peptidase M43, pregnancy-associated plasma-A n=1 Tax=Hirsutella rhossiliensis TaxID=111463 RepID=A0A9P8SMM5_9HYPO|nr:Peptidase M43, pregnancy-associated plasma-A [Hirsutella rhossiliensis]KAH0967474.1 Peptidase M43, pregnancy-associated plasma-A [Hirsutella rhossiliensis]